ncbi:MAG: ectoine/hydroxyectoine ABC transporter ATP-binding protein EhuA, partial [Bacilli bacterium]|nr:ectoine/hydroxyectoine ABC transporter ATP-binding protein EhuA [Bacilli bacterium]
NEGMTMEVVSHEMTFAESFATRVIFMDEGNFIEEGTSNQIFNQPKTERLQKFLDKIKL